MARPKKTDQATMVKIVEMYFEEVAGGDPAKMKFSRIEAYAAEKGYTVKAYDLRRDDAVRKRVDELTQMAEMKQESVAIAYKNLDVDQLIRRCASLEDLKRELYELDQSWKELYHFACDVNEKNQKFLAEKGSMEERIKELETECEELTMQRDSTKREVHSLQRENTYLKKMLKTYLYPNLADEILREAHLPVPDNKDVRPEAFNELIEGNTPLPFDGIQNEKEKPATRQDELLEEMRRQVRKNGK